MTICEATNIQSKIFQKLVRLLVRNFELAVTINHYAGWNIVKNGICLLLLLLNVFFCEKSF
jgi:hypothetical protein